jgi:hypothetical protein
MSGMPSSIHEPGLWNDLVNIGDLYGKLASPIPLLFWWHGGYDYNQSGNCQIHATSTSPELRD